MNDRQAIHCNSWWKESATKKPYAEDLFSLFCTEITKLFNFFSVLVSVLQEACAHYSRENLMELFQRQQCGSILLITQYNNVYGWVDRYT